MKYVLFVCVCIYIYLTNGDEVVGAWKSRTERDRVREGEREGRGKELAPEMTYAF